MHALILLAGGSGTRMQNAEDKTLLILAGRPVIAHSAQTFLKTGFIDHTFIVFRDTEQKKALEGALAPLALEPQFVQGGATRQDSVFNALQALPKDCTHVYIHDAARPLVSEKALQSLHATVTKEGAAVLAKPAHDTIKRITTEGEIQKILPEDLDRKRLWIMETPQAFTMPAILEAYQSAHAKQLQFTDDVAVAKHHGIPVTLVPNPDPNPKLTVPNDLAWAECLIGQ